MFAHQQVVADVSPVCINMSK